MGIVGKEEVAREGGEVGIVGEEILFVNVTSENVARGRELKLKKFSESGRIVVHHGLSIAKCLQERVHLRKIKKLIDQSMNQLINLSIK